MRIGLVGPSYQSQSVIADNQICLNWYPEVIESQSGKSRIALYPSPGTKVFATLPGVGAVRETLFFGTRMFAVAEKFTQPSSQQLFEVFQNGTSINRGQLGNVGTRPSMAVNNAGQLLIASGGRLFLFNLPDNTLQEIDTTTGAKVQGAVAKVGFSDAFFVALLSNSQKFQISGILDGTAWDPLDVAQVSRFADNILGMVVDHGEILFAGPKQSLAYYDTGNPDFPFEPIPGGFIEGGIHAPDSLTKLDNTTFWIGGDERGKAVGFRLQGYNPARISNHAVENAWQGYANATDAVGYAFQDRGHTFWHLYFPSAKKSWRYDIATSMWHEVAFNDGSAHRSQCHLLAFGKHLVGDWNSGNIYELSQAYVDDAGQVLRRTRRAPHVSNENKMLFHSELVLDVEAGLGPITGVLRDGLGFVRSPQIMLRWSDDGGKIWSNEHWADLGKVGEYKKRVVWRRLGRSRDRVYEVSVSDPVICRIVDAYLEVA